MNRIKVTYIAIDSDGNKPITSASSFEDLRKALDDYYAVGTGESKCLGFFPYDSKYPDEYEGYYEYESKRIVWEELHLEKDTIKVYCIEYYPYTEYEVED